MARIVVIGAGSAGCVLAARLSENPDHSILLIEAGGIDRHFLFRMPAGYFGILKSGMANWNYDTIPQTGLNGRRMWVPRGKVLGGSSSINGMGWLRGSAADFNHWKSMGCRGWGYDDVLPYLRKIESFQGDESQSRGQHGPIAVKPGPKSDELSVISKRWLAAVMAQGVPYNDDCNSSFHVGIGPIDVNSSSRRRQSSSQCYLKPALGRKNLHVITNALSSRVTIKGGRATGFEYFHERQRQYVEADEIILCGGAINSPQLLQLSGIGDAETIRAAGVEVVHDLPGVGQNLHDHIAIGINQEITKPYSLLAEMRPWKAASSILQYLLFETGPTTRSALELNALFKTNPAEKEPNLQMIVPPIMYQDHGRKIIRHEGFTVFINGLQPMSRGSVTIKSNDPSEAPLIDPNYLSDPNDIKVLREGIRMARAFVDGASFDDLRGQEYAPGRSISGDEDLDEYIRSNANSVYHPVGTCRMGEDDGAVVDSELRVRGLDGLRVVDASVIPRILSGTTNPATLMLAEKASDVILASHR